MNRTELLHIAKPILFNTEMTRAILDDRKTMTRRPIKLYKIRGEVCDMLAWEGIKFVGFLDCPSSEYHGQARFKENGFNTYKKSPYQVGDILYIRETWRIDEQLPYDNYIYKADDENPSGWHLDAWRPSIHMPKEAARIFLRVTNVRVERLQDILCGDMKKEGCIPMTVTGGQYQQWQRDYFIPLWNSTIKKTDLDRYGWVANPWVWVYEFERVVEE